VCDNCALIHHELGWSLSKLLHLSRDEFPLWLENLMTTHGGNKQCNALWEASIPAGWAKISPTSSHEKRRSFILSKYRWHAFTSDEHHNIPLDGLLQLLTHESGAVQLQVQDVHMFISRRVDINGEQGNASALQMALAYGNAPVACFLLLNGSSFSDGDLRQLSALTGAPLKDFATSLCAV